MATKSNIIIIIIFICAVGCEVVRCFYMRHAAMLKHVLAIACTSVRLSVRHTLVLYQNG